VRRWLAECYTHDNEVVEWTCRYGMVLVDVIVGTRSCLQVELAVSLARTTFMRLSSNPTIDPVLQAAHQPFPSQRGSEQGNILRPHPCLLVYTPGIGSIWATDTTIHIPTAKPATMGDVGDEEELDLSNPPFPLTAIDREILATRDEDYHRTTWSDLKQIIGIAESVHVKQYAPFLLTYTSSKQPTRTTQTPPVRSAQIPPLVVQDQESVRKHHEFRRPGTTCLDAQRCRSACHGTLFPTPLICTFRGSQRLCNLAERLAIRIRTRYQAYSCLVADADCCR
jgi:hypothetical protein